MRRWAHRRCATAVLGVVLALSPTAGAEPAHWYQRHTEGWFWYEDPPPPPEPEKPAEREPAAPAGPPHAAMEPAERLKQLQERLENTQARAVMEPTPANVAAFLELNREVHARATDFARTWQQVLWRRPDLDPTLVEPVNTAARQLWYDEQDRLLDGFLRETATRYGLWFFFRSDCPFCHRFAPILQQFAAQYGFEVLPVTQDGGGLPQFPAPRRDPGLGRELGVSEVPSVFLVEPRRREVHALTHGFIGPTELARRIFYVLEGEPPNPLVRRQP